MSEEIKSVLTKLPNGRMAVVAEKDLEAVKERVIKESPSLSAGEFKKDDEAKTEEQVKKELAVGNKKSAKKK